MNQITQDGNHQNKPLTLMFHSMRQKFSKDVVHPSSHITGLWSCKNTKHLFGGI